MYKKIQKKNLIIYQTTTMKKKKGNKLLKAIQDDRPIIVNKNTK